MLRFCSLPAKVQLLTRQILLKIEPSWAKLFCEGHEETNGFEAEWSGHWKFGQHVELWFDSLVNILLIYLSIP